MLVGCHGWSHAVSGASRQSAQGQRCIDAGGGTGRCALQCDRDEVCPMHFQCSPRMGVCEARLVGQTNGKLFLSGVLRVPWSQPETCLPTVQPSGSAGET